MIGIINLVICALLSAQISAQLFDNGYYVNDEVCGNKQKNVLKF